MINSKKKGFTIVELVIVIAVIAVLSAVLIPTFSNLVKKANISADQQAVVQMNKLLAIGESVNDKPESTTELVEVLIGNGYASDLTTYYSNYQLAWLSEENIIVLVENNQVVYPEEYEGTTTYEIINPMVKDIENLLDALEDGKTVFIADDIKTDGLSTEQAGVYTVNLNGNTLYSTGYVGSWVEDGKLIVSNGVIDASETNKNIAVYAQSNGIVELTNVQIYGASGINPVQCYGGTIILNNVTTSQTGAAETSWYNSAIQIANHLSYDEQKGYYFDGIQSYINVTGGMYSGDKAIQMSAPGGSVIINDGTFIGTTAAINADYNTNYASQGAIYSIIINGGNFTGDIKINNANISCIINGGTFNVDISNVANVTIGSDKIVVNNGNGTWTVK